MSFKVRLIVQRCLEAKILVDNVSEYEAIGEGVVIFIAFLKGADKGQMSGADKSAALRATVERLLASNALHAGPRSSERESTSEHQNILVIPQAAMGGKLKGKSVQFHANVAKDEAKALYDEFVDLLKEEAAKNEKFKHGKVVNGVYANRQGFQMISDGPNTYFLEF